MMIFVYKHPNFYTLSMIRTILGSGYDPHRGAGHRPPGDGPGRGRQAGLWGQRACSLKLETRLSEGLRRFHYHGEGPLL